MFVWIMDLKSSLIQNIVSKCYESHIFVRTTIIGSIASNLGLRCGLSLFVFVQGKLKCKVILKIRSGLNKQISGNKYASSCMKRSNQKYRYCYILILINIKAIKLKKNVFVFNYFLFLKTLCANQYKILDPNKVFLG